MLNVGRKLKKEGDFSFILLLMKDVMSQPCAGCNNKGGYAAILTEVTGKENEPFALPICPKCEQHPVCSGRIIVGSLSN